MKRYLLRNFQLVFIVWSECDPFFPVVDIDTILVVVERLDDARVMRPEREPARLITLRKPLGSLLPAITDATYWSALDRLASMFETASAVENDDYRVHHLDCTSELAMLDADPRKSTNWARLLKSSAIWNDVFEGSS